MQSVGKFLVGGLLLPILLAGCGLWGGEEKEDESVFRKAEYKKSRIENSLEVPPDLSRLDRDDSLMVPDIAPSATARYSDYARERDGGAARVTTATPGVLPTPDNVKFYREGKLSWLEVEGRAENIWPKVRQFWLDNGFELVVDNPAIAVLETGWAENRADIPQDFIRRTLSRAFDAVYSASTRDKYRTRLERGRQAGTTEIYLTHRGMHEVSQAGEFVWEPRPSDPGLEAEMLHRLMLHLGMEKERAREVLTHPESPGQQRQIRLLMTEGQPPTLVIPENFARAWRMVGLTLDRTGFTVEDRNRAEGVYYLRYVDSEFQLEEEDRGFFSKLAFWDSDEVKSREIHLTVHEEGGATRVRVLDEQDQPVPDGVAAKILKLMLKNLED